jgi:hypothetical protein
MFPYISIPIDVRQRLTRLLCWMVVGGWIVLLIAVVMLVAVLAGALPASKAEQLIVQDLEYWIGASLLSGLAMGVLWLWRTCDRCSRRLFEDPRDPFSGLDYRARRLLGSYRRAAVLEMARAGRLRCMSCGHEDGRVPDYVVEGPGRL